MAKTKEEALSRCERNLLGDAVLAHRVAQKKPTEPGIIRILSALSLIDGEDVNARLHDRLIFGRPTPGKKWKKNRKQRTDYSRTKRGASK